MVFIKSYTFPFDTDLIKKDSLGKSGVYLILNLINKNCYIGSAISKTSSHNRLYFRFRNHFFSSFKYSNLNLRRSMDKYGNKNFTFNILAYDIPDNIINLENYFIDKIKPQFNILSSALDSTGYKHTVESKKKISDSEIKLFILNFNMNKTLKNSTSELISKKMKASDIFDKFRLSKSKPTIVLNLSGNLIKEYQSAKEIIKDYKIDYRTVRKHLKNNIPIKKLGIITEEELENPTNNKEYAIRPKYGDKCWYELLKFRIHEI